MANIFPEQLPESILQDPKRSAERKVFEALRQLDNNFTVFYSVAWVGKIGGTAAIDGEADFVIAHPEFGVLVIEVKGGAIEYDAHLNKWYSTDRVGNQHSIKDPFSQASNSKHQLLKKFQNLPGWKNRWLTMAHAVVFPDVQSSGRNLKPDAPKELLLDRNSLQSIQKSTEAVFIYFSSKGSTNGKLGSDRLSQVISLLGNSFKLETPLGVEFDLEDQKLVTLTDRQFMLLDFLGSRRRALIKGCAGSGKTMLAIEKANRLADESFNVLFVCFNSPLAQYLRNRVSENVTVYNYHNLCRDLINEVGFIIEAVEDEDSLYRNVFPNALMQIVDEIDLRYDAIVVDEGQDFLEEWWISLFALLEDDSNGIVYVFYDNNQNIYDRFSVEDIFDEDPFVLSENCRNTLSIHNSFSQYHSAPDSLTCPGPVGREPEVVAYKNEKDMIKVIGSKLHQLLVDEKVSNEDVVILTPKSFEHSFFQPNMEIGNMRLVDRPPHAQFEVQVSSVHRYKGLESKVALVAELDGSLGANQEEVLYVAYSRARTHLITLAKDSFKAGN